MTYEEKPGMDLQGDKEDFRFHISSVHVHA